MSSIPKPTPATPPRPPPNPIPTTISPSTICPPPSTTHTHHYPYTPHTALTTALHPPPPHNPKHLLLLTPRVTPIPQPPPPTFPELAKFYKTKWPFWLRPDYLEQEAHEDNQPVCIYHNFSALESLMHPTAAAKPGDSGEAEQTVKLCAPKRRKKRAGAVKHVAWADVVST